MIRTNYEGQVVFSFDDDQEIESALRHIFNTTEVGQDYKKNYATMDRIDADYDKLVRAASIIAGGNFINEQHLEHALHLLIQSGELRPKKATPVATFDEPEVDTRPRDKNGKVLTPQQIQWSEYRQWSETASSAEVTRRKQLDAGYAAYVRKSLEAEFEGVGDAAIIAGQSTTKARLSNELTDFALKYNKEPIANLRPKGGFVTLAGEQLSWATFQDLLNRATAAGVIR